LETEDGCSVPTIHDTVERHRKSLEDVANSRVTCWRNKLFETIRGRANLQHRAGIGLSLFSEDDWCQIHNELSNMVAEKIDKFYKREQYVSLVLIPEFAIHHAMSMKGLSHSEAEQYLLSQEFYDEFPLPGDDEDLAVLMDTADSKAAAYSTDADKDEPSNTLHTTDQITEITL
ncbi:unnamed protein product, partial [Owenia fusiformis]